MFVLIQVSSMKTRHEASILRIPLNVAQHSEMISPSIPI